MKTIRLVLPLLVGAFLPTICYSQGYRFAVIPDTIPQTTDARPYSINDSGAILIQTYSFGNLGFSEILNPDGSTTQPEYADSTGLDNVGDTINASPPSFFGSATYWVVAANGSQTQLNVPFVSGNIYLNGINNAQTIVGSGVVTDGLDYGVIIRGGVFSQYTYPGSTGCALTGINDAGDMVGTYYTNKLHKEFFGFVVSGGKASKLSVPGCFDVSPTAISDNGTIAGSALLVGEPGIGAGFVLSSKGAAQTIDYRPFAPKSVPGPSGPLRFTGNPQTRVYGVNSKGQIVGQFSATYGTGSSAETIYIPFVGTPENGGH